MYSYCSLVRKHFTLFSLYILFLFFFAKKKTLPSFSSKSLRHKLFLLLLQHFFTKDFPPPILFQANIQQKRLFNGLSGMDGVLKEFGISLCPRKCILPPMLKYKKRYVGLNCPKLEAASIAKQLSKTLRRYIQAFVPKSKSKTPLEFGSEKIENDSRKYHLSMRIT